MLDTNVIISAAINPDGAPASVLRMFLSGAGDACTSSPLLSELEGVLSREKIRRRLSADAEEDLFSVYCAVVAIVPVRRLPARSSDPDDDHVLAAADAASADYIVTGDDHLLRLETHGDARIVTPREFLDIIAKR